jgi:hypothetical protein
MMQEDDDAVMQEAQAMLRQLVELRLQIGATQFRATATQMGMPQEVLDIVEQAAAQVEGAQPAPSPLSGLVSASGQPLGSQGNSGLIMPDGTTYQPQAADQSADGFSGGEPDISSLLDEDDQASQAQQMFQELLGVRLVIGQQNFATLTERMDMSSDASDAIEATAVDIEQQIDERYPNQDEANTVRLLNARMMMGEDRFGELADQVGMPQEMRDGLEDIARQIESQQGEDDEPDLQA